MKITGVNLNRYELDFRDGCSTNWSSDLEHNLAFIRITMQYAQDRLQAQGFLFVNDVLDMLGYAKTPEGQVLGWLKDSKSREIWSFTKDIHDNITITLIPDGVTADKI